MGSESIWLEDQGVSVVMDFEKKQQLGERKRAEGAGGSLRVTSIRVEDSSSEIEKKRSNIFTVIFVRMRKRNADASKKLRRYRL